MLLEREDIDVNCQNGSGNTALMLVAWYGHGAIFKMLLERGDIDVNCKDGDDEDIDFESSTDLSQSIKDELAARSNTAKGFKAVGVDCVPSEGSAFLVGETEM
ncbi:uncharacterized protein LAJ45_03532 [Morchella importuna]|uniref:uncharacterized protein n=1 Tax=Morchella importuna TaxID=1174673 RepID=UPI001E8DA7F6|nr:uncharacterized protein LAJ45_03532 [Morchella importuna]KAH8152690.1 hypothetical protein LAJ45_03532 [Morchella importuna]